MNKMSIKKLSILGLVLTAASAVTAAVLPATKESDDNLAPGGTLRDSSAGEGQTCVLTQNARPNICTLTAASDTSTNVGVGDTSTDTDVVFDGTSTISGDNTTA